MPHQLQHSPQASLPVAKSMDEPGSPYEQVTITCHALPLRLPLRVGACQHISIYIYIMHFAITTRFQTTFGIQHLRSGQWGMVHPPTSNTCSKNMFVKLLGPDLQNIYSTQSLSSSAPGLLASGIGSWPTCCSRATRSNATAVKAQQRVQSCLRLCRILQCHEIQGKHSAHTPLHTQGVLVVRGFGLRSRCLLAFRL